MKQIKSISRVEANKDEESIEIELEFSDSTSESFQLSVEIGGELIRAMAATSENVAKAASVPAQTIQFQYNKVTKQIRFQIDEGGGKYREMILGREAALKLGEALVATAKQAAQPRRVH